MAGRVALHPPSKTRRTPQAASGESQMKTTLITDRLEQESALLAWVRAAFKGGVPTAYPAAYVAPLSEQADNDMDTESQRVTFRFAVEVMVKNAAQDGGGGEASNDLDDVRADVFQAIVGWIPQADTTPVQHVSGRLISFDAGLVVWRDEFFCVFYR